VVSSVVCLIPTHNEATNISRVLSEVRAALPEIDIAVVDDSDDETPCLAASMGADVVRMPCRLGYGAAVQTGFKYAIRQGYEFGVLFDGDGQHDPGSIQSLLAEVQSGRADVAVGSRFLGQITYHLPLSRRLGLALLRRIVSAAIGGPITDPSSGFQALNRRAMAFFARGDYPTDFPVGETLIQLHYAGFRLTEVPVIMRARLEGISMFAGFRPVYYAAKMLLAIFIVWLRRVT